MVSNRILKPNMGRTVWNPDQKPPYGARINPKHPLNQGLKAYWLLNESGGNTAFDASGNSCHGTLQSQAIWGSGPSLSLSGAVNSFVDVGTPSAIVGLTGPMTLIGSFIQSSTTGNQAIFGQYKSTSLHQLPKLIRLDGGILMYYYDRSTGNYSAVGGNLTTTTGVLYNYAVVVKK